MRDIGYRTIIVIGSAVSNISYKSTGKSTSKSLSHACFYGIPADHDYPAKFWIFAFQLYSGAEDDHSIVADSTFDKPGHHLKQHRKRNCTE